jgi:hypothetical protein
MQILERFIEPALNQRVKFVYSKNSESQKMMAEMFDLDKLESAFGGRNTSDLDIAKYAERMTKQDQLRGCCKHTNLVFTSRGTEPLKPTDVL